MTGALSLKIANESLGYSRLLVLFACSNLWTLILTVIPVISTVQPSDYYTKRVGWYTGADVMRFIEPIGGLQFNFWIFFESGIFSRPRSRAQIAYIFVFILGASLYVQGAGLHSGANMFKNCLETVMEVHDDDRIFDLYVYMRTVWEHLVSHYIYAVGYSMMAFSHFLVYKDHMLSASEDIRIFGSTNGVLKVFVAAIPYGVLIAAVAAEFPSGSLVALIYTILYGVLGIGGYLVYLWYRDVYSRQQHESSLSSHVQRVGNGISAVVGNYDSHPAAAWHPTAISSHRNIVGHTSDTNTAVNDTTIPTADTDLRDGRSSRTVLYSLAIFIRYRPIALYFLFSYAIGLVLDIIWIIAVGGLKSRQQSGITSS